LPESKAQQPALPKRRPLPPELPREDIRLAPASNTCPDCGHALRFIRDEISERLEYVPARFIVHRHIRPQFSCEHCDTVVSAALMTFVKDFARTYPAQLKTASPLLSLKNLKQSGCNLDFTDSYSGIINPTMIFVVSLPLSGCRYWTQRCPT
jgi:hypothetical protein